MNSIESSARWPVDMAVRSLDLAVRLRELGLRVFTTADVRTLTRLKTAAAAQLLRRLIRAGAVVRLKRGVWALRQSEGLDPQETVGHLAFPWPAYVSLHSALSNAGLIAEIPQRVYAVTTGPSRVWRTPLGTIEAHHLDPRRFFGWSFGGLGPAKFRVASPEKAFLDTLYLSLVPRSPIRMPPRRDGRWPLDRKAIREMTRRFDYPPLTARLKRLGLG